ncbi:MAG: MRP8 family protein [Thermoanaerobaculum sp.]|nr:MRP8 family protein [Thermoanaerobaculum sp.]MDW7968692.1 hypothetical protein [Thermoanaerobaculum sp.]
MADALERYRDTVARLRQGPHPQGEAFDLCREVLAVAPHTPEAQQALRYLLEGAMADAHTSIADAQVIMALLKALDREQVRWEQLLPAREGRK